MLGNLTAPVIPVLELTEFSVEALQQWQAVVTHELRRRKILRVRDKVEALLDTEGLTLWDLLADTQVVSFREGLPETSPRQSPLGMTKKSNACPEDGGGAYLHATNPELKWMGTGQRPRWLKDWLAEGKRLEDLLVVPQESKPPKR